MSAELATVDTAYINTVDVTTKEGAIKIANALNASVSLADYESDVLEIVDIVTTPGNRAQSGDACINTYLILADGTTLFSQSEGIARSAKFIYGLLKDYIHEGIKAHVKTTKLRSGNTLKSLELLPA